MHTGVLPGCIKSVCLKNSIAAIDCAVKCRCEIIEIDAKLTKDGVLVLMHDETIVIVRLPAPVRLLDLNICLDSAVFS